MKVKICEICGTEKSDGFYKEPETGKIICEECLIWSDKIMRETVTHYYLDGEYVGDSDHIEDAKTLFVISMTIYKFRRCFK